MSENKTDKMVLELLKKVEEKKKQIGNAERPSWITNCSFRYNPDTNAAVNIQVAGLETLVDIHAFLTAKYAAFNTSLSALGLTEKEVSFRHCNFTYDQWVEDIQTRIASLRIKAKRDELAALESRINALVSPEQRRAIELEKLVKEMA